MPLLAICLLAIGVTSLPARAATFACQGRLKPTERMICTDPELSRLDDQLNALYNGLGTPSQTRKGAQINWMIRRNLCRDNIACIGEFYKNRIAELKVEAADAPLTPSSSNRVAASPPSSSSVQTPTIPQDVPRSILREQSTAAVPLAAAAGNASATSQPLQVGRPAVPAAEQMVYSLPDRMIWEGTSRCGGPNEVKSSLVLMATSVKEAKEAYFLTDQSSARYSAKYDEILDEIDLRFLNNFYQGGMGLSPPQQISLAMEKDQSIITGHLYTNCDVRIIRKAYSTPFIAQLSLMKADASFMPVRSLSSAQTDDEFCLTLDAWARKVKSVAGNRDITKRPGSDPASQMFMASIFYDRFADPYLGGSVKNIANSGSGSKIRQSITQCQQNPLFVEDKIMFNSIFYNGLNNGNNLFDTLGKLSEIQDRIERIVKVGDRFTADAAGLVKLQEYSSPLELELANVIAPTRELMLRSLWQRQTQIAAAVLNAEPETTEQVRSVDYLVSLDAAVHILKDHGDLYPNSSATIIRAQNSISRSLRRLLDDNPLPMAKDTSPTLDDLVQLKGWQNATAARFGKFAAYQPYQDAMASAEARIATMQQAIVQQLPTIVAEAKDVTVVRAILASIDKYQAGVGEGRQYTPFMQAFSRGVRGWMSAIVTRASTAVTNGGDQPIAEQSTAATNPLGGLATLPTGDSSSSVFTSRDLKEPGIVEGVYKRDFRSIYQIKNKAQGYLFQMLQTIGPACPGIVSADFVKVLAVYRYGPEIISDPTKGAVNALLDALKDTADGIKNPGQYMDRTFADADLAGRAQADSQLILQSIPCVDQRLITFVANAKEFFSNPAAGVPISSMTMIDVCKAAQAPGETEDRKVKYCTCAAPILERNMRPADYAYVRLNPRETFWNAIQLLPEVRADVGKCSL
jgi:uncharacterized protein